jgi:hypothetical protein
MFRVFFLLLLCFLSACSSQQTKVNQVRRSFAQGNLPVASSLLDAAIPSKNNIYNLEQGNIYRLMGQNKITQSTEQFLAADAILRQNELQRSSIKGSLSTLGGYVLAEGIGKEYEMKGYEGSLLAYSLALNHVLIGNWENARVEVMKMIKREQDLAEFNEAKYRAIEEQRTKGGNASGHIDNRFQQGNPIINGYPVNTISTPETLKLKNSYQSAAAHYLAAFIFEKLKEPSLAAPGYRQAIELRPDLPFLQDGLRNLDANIQQPLDAGPKGSTDTLIIVESGFMPYIDSFKVNIPIPINRQIVFATVSYPYIAPNSEQYNPGQVLIDNQLNNLKLVTNVDAMARRDLQDAMPGYMVRAASRAIAQVVAQVGTQRAIQGNNQNNSNQAALGAIAGLITGLTMAEVSSADVRHWSNLPANIFLARAQIPNGTREFLIRAQNGSYIGRPINFGGDKQVVYVRVFTDRATIMTSNDSNNPSLVFQQPIPMVIKNSASLTNAPTITNPMSNFPPPALAPSQPNVNLKR